MKNTNQIQTGTNYKMFQVLKGNRPIVPSKIKNLVKSYEGGLNLFPYCPILINNGNYVIDGQHRLEACKKLKIPVYYMVCPEVSLLQIAQLNAAASRWKTSDFFNCFIETGNKDYTTLQTFTSKYGISINLAIQLLMYGGVSGGGQGSEEFKQGLFKLKHYEKAEKLMKAANDYYGVCEDTVLKDRYFIRAVQMLLASSLYIHTQVIEKLKARKSIITKKENHKEYIYQIEELFNRGNSKRYFIYEAPKTTSK